MWVDEASIQAGRPRSPSTRCCRPLGEAGGVLASATQAPKATSRLACPTTPPSTSVAPSTIRTTPSPTRPISRSPQRGVPQRPTRRDRDPDGRTRTHACAVHVVLCDAKQSNDSRAASREDSDAGRRRKERTFDDFVEDEETSLLRCRSSVDALAVRSLGSSTASCSRARTSRSCRLGDRAGRPPSA